MKNDMRGGWVLAMAGSVLCDCDKLLSLSEFVVFSDDLSLVGGRVCAADILRFPEISSVAPIFICVGKRVCTRFNAHKIPAPMSGFSRAGF